jgi:hypothetical protein
LADDWVKTAGLSMDLWGPLGSDAIRFRENPFLQQIQGSQQMNGQENLLASLNLLEIIHDEGAGYSPRMVF